MIHLPILLLINLFPLQFSESLSNSSPLFASDELLTFTISGDTRSLFKDRIGQPKYYPITLSYEDENADNVSIDLKVKTRGNFRRKKGNCVYPPLLLNFSRLKTPKSSLFAGQDKLKLVTPCQGAKYVVKEYLAYKLYNLITEQSFRARLVKVIFDDSKKGKKTDPLYGILLEDEDQMAARNKASIFKKNRVRPNKTEPSSFLKMAVFEYMIGNTDWSTQYRHNVKLLNQGSALLATVPYDFDHAGIVHAPYAKPAPALLLESTRVRRYRGYCLSSLEKLDPVFALFNELKDDFYKVYENCEHLEKSDRKSTLKFLDQFYKIINDPKAKEMAFNYPCDPKGTGKVVISGFQND